LGNITKLEESYIINRWQGVILLFCAIGYIVYTIYEEKTIKNKTIEKEIIEEVELKEINSGVIIVIYLILGILGLKFGSNFVVDNSILIAEKFGLSENIIGMTIIAVGTALPEIITGIIAAKRNETDLLLGNITGSNILNLLLLIGLGAVISPIKLMSNFNMTMLVLIAVTILLKFVSNINKNNELDKKEGVLLITIYVIYILFAILV
jgi:K+-dependent Na+/Ca+ exchanger-like protein